MNYFVKNELKQDCSQIEKELARQMQQNQQLIFAKEQLLSELEYFKRITSAQKQVPLKDRFQPVIKSGINPQSISPLRRKKIFGKMVELSPSASFVIKKKQPASPLSQLYHSHSNLDKSSNSSDQDKEKYSNLQNCYNLICQQNQFQAKEIDRLNKLLLDSNRQNQFLISQLQKVKAKQIGLDIPAIPTESRVHVQSQSKAELNMIVKQLQYLQQNINSENKPILTQTIFAGKNKMKKMEIQHQLESSHYEQRIRELVKELDEVANQNRYLKSRESLSEQLTRVDMVSRRSASSRVEQLFHIIQDGSNNLSSRIESLIKKY